jgi:amino-acid N-acetyltransferase
MDIKIEAAHTADWLALQALITGSGLPLDGLADHLTTTLIARDGDNIIGSAALEVYGDAALLRSVAVAATHRSQGLGQQLTALALELARSRNVREVYLLTETAAEFFPRFGFAPLLRDAVTPAVQQSVEFQSACPASALVMRAELT